VATVHQGGGQVVISPLFEELQRRVRGEVRFDRLARTLYATDASIYEIIPAGVVCPQDVDDVVATLKACAAHGESLIARGAGTGLTGGAVGHGVQLDLARFMRRIGVVDAARQTVEVEPGVVLDELNAFLQPHGLMFAPDVATSSRATVGGMIANNSCGARSVRYGRTVDHVGRLTVVVADGEVVRFDREQAPTHGSRAARIEQGLAKIRDEHHDEIQTRFPKIMRSNGGYGLDRLGAPGARADATGVLCGSEGTLGVVVAATLSLVPIPKERSVVLLLFENVLDALAATPQILEHEPSAVELVDHLILAAGRSHARIAAECGFIHGDPGALLIVEFEGDDPAALRRASKALLANRDAMGEAYEAVTLPGAARQAALWNLRKSGLGLLMSRPGDEQSYSFVEDTAVDPKRLRDYIARVQDLLRREGVEAGYYAHASVGCIHIRPVLNLRTDGGVEKLRRIAGCVSDLVIEFGGTITGEHGDGIVRSCWLEKLYGPRLLTAFADVKNLFDPDRRLNPNKIVDPWPMTEHLRYGSGFQPRAVKTTLDFSLHGGMAGLAGMCSGVGLCRQTLVGTMCPSFVATLDERHTTRARANALRHALSNRGLLSGLGDPALDEVMDLCVSCKACKTECPTGVDMARLKAEHRFRVNITRGVSRRGRLVADLPDRLAKMSRLPRTANIVAQSGVVRAMMQWRYGLDRRVRPPKLAPHSFRDWFRRHVRDGRRVHQASRGVVIYFVDTWTNYVAPEAGMAAVTLLERAGFNVHCPQTYCCGRPALSQGLLTEVRQLAEWNIATLQAALGADVPVLFTEPSCHASVVDEYPQLVPSGAAKRLADRSFLIESFLRRVLDEDPMALSLRQRPTSLLLHAHCHQKALVGTDDTVALLQLAFGGGVSELDAGCCGMAGAFGHEREHYEIAKAMGEHRLFPAVRQRGEAEIAVTGFSCRQQIAHHTDVQPRHALEWLASALASESGVAC